VGVTSEEIGFRNIAERDIFVKSIGFSASARRSWRGLPPDVRLRLDTALKRYAETGVGDVKRLAGRDGLRLRWGDYRVLFVENASGIDVRAVGHRKDIYL
jgi:mRNA interferase RelE/StbE